MTLLTTAKGENSTLKKNVEVNCDILLYGLRAPPAGTGPCPYAPMKPGGSTEMPAARFPSARATHAPEADFLHAASAHALLLEMVTQRRHLRRCQRLVERRINVLTSRLLHTPAARPASSFTAPCWVTRGARGRRAINRQIPF